MKDEGSMVEDMARFGEEVLIITDQAQLRRDHDHETRIFARPRQLRRCAGRIERYTSLRPHAGYLHPSAFKLHPSDFCLLPSAFCFTAYCLLPTVLNAQGCAMCYTSASAAKAGAKEALANGVLILLVPPMVFFALITVVVYMYRNKFRETSVVSGPLSDCRLSIAD